MERRKALQLLFPHHFQHLQDQRNFNDLTTYLLSRTAGEGATLADRGISPMEPTAGEAPTPPVIPSTLPKDDSTLSPLHVEEGSSEPDPKVALLEAQISSLRRHVDMLERELEAKSKRRFICC
jgi:hypothetical protein